MIESRQRVTVHLGTSVWSQWLLKKKTALVILWDKEEAYIVHGPDPADVATYSGWVGLSTSGNIIMPITLRHTQRPA